MKRLLMFLVLIVSFAFALPSYGANIYWFSGGLQGGAAKDLDNQTSTVDTDGALVLLKDYTGQSDEGDWYEAAGVPVGNVFMFYTLDVDSAVTEATPEAVTSGDGSDERWEYSGLYAVWTEFIPVAWMEDGTSAPGASTTEDNIAYRNFADDSTQDLEFVWRAPFDLVGGRVKVQVICVITNATAPADTEGVSWNVAACSITGDESHDCSLGTACEPEDTDMDDHASAQWDIVYIGSECVDDPDAANGFVEVTPTGLDNGELVKFAIERDHDDPIDDYAQDIGLVGINIKYKSVTTSNY